MMHRQYIYSKPLSLFLNSLLRLAGGPTDRKGMWSTKTFSFGEHSSAETVKMKLSWYLWCWGVFHVCYIDILWHILMSTCYFAWMNGWCVMEIEARVNITLFAVGEGDQGSISCPDTCTCHRSSTGSPVYWHLLHFTWAALREIKLNWLILGYEWLSAQWLLCMFLPCICDDAQTSVFLGLIQAHGKWCSNELEPLPSADVSANCSPALTTSWGFSNSLDGLTARRLTCSLNSFCIFLLSFKTQFGSPFW